MKLLAEMSDKSLGLSEYEILGTQFELRKSARAILVREDGNIAIQHLENHHHHKLPGGGVDSLETLYDALAREIKEEVGCDMKILKEIGVVIEYREKHNLLHISYCYSAQVVGPVAESKLEQAEIDEGMTTIWMSPESAIQKMEADVPNVYQGKFILQRELAFLKEFVKGLGVR